MGKINKLRPIVIGNLILLLCIHALYNSSFLQTVDHWILDYQMKKTATHLADEHVVVVAIDDYSIEQLGQFPWDRSIYAPFLELLNSPLNEPAAIAFDIFFSEPTDDDSDAYFAQALEQYSNIILPVVGVTEGELFSSTRMSKIEPIQVGAVIKNLESFSIASHAAHINRVTHNSSGVIRQMWLHIEDEAGNLIPSLAYKAVELGEYDLSYIDEATDRQKYNTPNAKHTLTIDFNLKSEDITTISFVDVLNGDIPPEHFKDAIIFVGFTATGIGNEVGTDSGSTPLEDNVKLVYVHANIANQLINQTLITYVSYVIEYSTLILVLLAFIVIAWRFKPVYSALILVTAAMLLFLIQSILFHYENTYLTISTHIIAIIVIYLFNMSMKAYREQQQKSFVTRQFGRYISPELVKDIVQQEIDIKLGGITKEVTVLFLDIRGFTTLSEKLTPSEVVDILNTKFTMITNTVLKYKGSIDKFIGDAAMILFNAPLDVDNHEKQAVLTAYEIQQNMIPIQQEMKVKYGVEVAIGIGIHTGPVIIGNIGSYLRMDYTAIGDTVNTASRIESSTSKGQILVSEAIYLKTKQWAEYGEPEAKLFKGKTVAINVYEVIRIGDM